MIGNEESVIKGAMNANGNVFISNPNGVLIGKEAQINVGSLVATTQQLKDDDLMNGKLKFSGQAGGKVENLANITVPKGGVIALIAPIVKNSGKLTASEGTVLLASAEQFAITLPKDHFSYTIERGTLQGLIDNQGAILADGGRVVLTAKGLSAVKKSVIKHSGSIEANTVSNKNGVVELLGDLDNSELQMSGSIKAEAPNGGNGGFVETSAAKVKIEKTAKVSTKAKNGKTGEWLIDPTDFTVHAGEGEKTTSGIGATTLQSSLTETNVTLATAAGGSEDGNIYVNAPVTWNKNRLTLSAHNDIHINKTLNGTGTAKLALEYGQGSEDGGEADYYLDKNTPLASRTVKVNLPEGKNFTTKKGSEGEVVEYEVIHRMPEIVRNENERNGEDSTSCKVSCEQWKSQFTASNIAFGKDIDLSYTANYQGFAGWDVPRNENSILPIRIEGLGHQVDNLTLASKKDRQPTGLFTQMHNGLGTIRNIGVTNMNISSGGEFSNAGGLIGQYGRNIKNSFASGNVTTSGVKADTGGLVGHEGNDITDSYVSVNVATSGYDSDAGGLVGSHGRNISNSYANGNISTSGYKSAAGGLIGYIGNNVSNSYASSNVVASGDDAPAGGLIGNDGQNITKSHTSGKVMTSGNWSNAGGLVGVRGLNITNSYSNSNITTSLDNASAGGLVGHTGNDISDSYATGDITTFGNVAYAGGLVGFGALNIVNSHSSGSIATHNHSASAGGLIGNGVTNITNSYSSSSVKTSMHWARAGGLVGERAYNITNSYASGNIITQGDYAYSGGLVGDNGNNITNSYASGNITTSGKLARAGGLVGVDGQNITNSYASGRVMTSGEDTNAGGVVGNAGNNITNTYFNVNQVSSAQGEVNSYGTGVSEQALKQKTTFENWDFDTIWRIDEGRDTPRLRALTEATLVVTPTVPVDPEPDTSEEPIMPPAEPDPAPTPPVAEQPEILKNTASLTANNLSKTYDGEAVNTEADLAKLEGWNGTGYTVSGLKEGDSADSIFNGGLTFNGARSTWKGAVNAGDYVLDPTADLTEAAKQKYEIVWNTGKLTINKRPLSLIGTKTYNGNPFVRAGDFTRVNGFVEKDKALIYDNQNKLLTDTLSGSVSATGSEVREEAYRLKDSVGLTLKEALAKNYEINPANSMVFVTPAALKVSLHGRRQYDGTKDAVVDDNTVLEGQVGNDDVSLVKGGKGTLKSENAGKQPLVDLGNIALTGAKAKNYKLTTEGSYWDIAKRPLIIQAMNNIRPLNGSNPSKDDIGIVADGLVSTDTISDVDVNIFYPTPSPFQHFGIKEQEIGGENVIRPSNAKFSKGSADNYDIKYKDGTLLVVQDAYDYTKFLINVETMHKDQEIMKKYLNISEVYNDDALLAKAVYGKDANAKGNERFYELYEVEDQSIGKKYKELKPMGFVNSNDALKYKKLYSVVRDRLTNKPISTDFDDNADSKYKGLSAALYQCVDVVYCLGLKDYYIVFRGTDKKIQDTIHGNSQGIGLIPTQYKEAVNFTSGVVNKFGISSNNMKIIGHSLGGGLSMHSVLNLKDDNYDKKVETVVFNPAGLNSNSHSYAVVNEYNNIHINSYDNDFLRKISNYFIGNYNEVNLLANHSLYGARIVGNMLEDHGMQHILMSNKLIGLINDNFSKEELTLIKENKWTKPYTILEHSYDVVKDVGGEVIYDTIETISSGIERVKEGVTDTNEKIKEVGGSIIYDTVSGISSGIDSVKNKITNINEKIKDVGGGIIHDTVEDVSSRIETIKGKVNEISESIIDFTRDNKLLLPEQGKVERIDLENGVFVVRKTPMIKLGGKTYSYQSGYKINQTDYEVDANGNSKLKLNIFNSLPATLEVQVLDREGNVIGRYFAQPKLLNSSLVGSYLENIKNFYQDVRGYKTGFENGSTSSESEIELAVPNRGSLKFTYNSEMAKFNTFVGPVSEFIDKISSALGYSLGDKVKEKISDSVIRKVIANLAKSSGKHILEDKVGDESKFNLIVNIVKETFEELSNPDNLDGDIIDLVDVAIFAKYAESLSSISYVRDFAEYSVVSMNILSAMLNYMSDFSQFDYEVKNK